MLTIEPLDHNLKITWTLTKPLSSELPEFLKIETLDPKRVIKNGRIHIIGEEEIPLAVWHGFLSFIQGLLDRGIELHFSSTSKKIEETLRLLGFGLLGEII